MKINNFFLLFFAAMLLISCKSDKSDDPSLLGVNYYPVEQGTYKIYDVIDTTFLDGEIDVILHYEIKEEIRKPITVQGETRHQVYVYYRTPPDPWNDYPDSNWTEFNDNSRAVRVENNVRIVKLIFPLEINKTWDGNVSDNRNDSRDHYTLKQVKRPFEYDSVYYPKTVTVVQKDESSNIDRYYANEVYAENRGLVYKRIIDLYYDQTSVGSFNIDYGRSYTQKLIEHGRY